MDVSGTLKAAWSAVQAADLPDVIHDTAFREAVRMLSMPATPASLANPAPQNTARSTNSYPNDNVGAGSGSATDNGGITLTEDQLFGKVQNQTNVPVNKLAEIAHIDGGSLRISIPGIKLGKNNAEKTRAIAQIIAIIRGFGLDEADTSVELVRAEAQRLKCYDSANFASQLGKLTGYIITGSSSNRRIRTKAAGIQSFSTLVDSLLTES